MLSSAVFHMFTIFIISNMCKPWGDHAFSHVCVFACIFMVFVLLQSNIFWACRYAYRPFAFVASHNFRKTLLRALFHCISSLTGDSSLVLTGQFGPQVINNCLSLESCFVWTTFIAITLVLVGLWSAFSLKLNIQLCWCFRTCIFLSFILLLLCIHAGQTAC